MNLPKREALRVFEGKLLHDNFDMGGGADVEW
jgi:hypothetical protein